MASAESEQIHDRLLRRIVAGTTTPISDDEFTELAASIFRHQYGCNAPYRAFCDRRGVRPDGITHWMEIPAVPADAFKAAALVCGDPADAEAVFLTSGTTQSAERKGRHFFPNLALYDAALRAGFRAHLLPDGARPRMLALVPTPAEAPDSSLSHMIGVVFEDFGAPGSGFFLSGDGIDMEALLPVLRRAEADGDAVCLLGTSLAYVHLLDSLRETGERLRLPPGSRLMDTGGFKGRSREISREALYAQIHHRLGIPPAWSVNEYGMTEMSSQFYDTVAGSPEGAAVAERLHRGPPWVRTRAVDPETLALLPAEETGVLRHWDLANFHSVMALQTADLGVCLGDGFRVLGRARGAEARGCSLAVDELLSALRRS